MFNIEYILYKTWDNIYWNIESVILEKWPDIFWALIILIFWFLSAFLVYKFINYLFKKFKILSLIDKLNSDIEKHHEKREVSEKKENNISKKKKNFSEVFWKKIHIDDIIAKAMAYYIFLIFFRWSIYKMWITEVEQFLKQLIEYLPDLFIWIFILYFWIRFANFIYNIIYHSLKITKQKTAKIIASGWKIIILFFTLMVVLNKIWIDTQIINTILIWFISMITIAWGLAFGLWWKDIAKEILESFRK